MKKVKKKVSVSKPKAKASVKSAANKAVIKSKPAIQPSAKPAAKAAAKIKPVVISKPAAKGPAPVQSKHPKGNSKVSTDTRTRMNKEEFKHFERILNEKKETLIQELDYIEDNSMRLNAKDGSGDLSSHAYHLADQATETQDREQAFHMASREGRYLLHIEEALDRIRAGTYGLCKNCGKLIPKARLEAVPTAKMCIQCKAKQEQAIEADAAA